jgi:archaellum biogenesis protein FlaJ (TadC family)
VIRVQGENQLFIAEGALGTNLMHSNVINIVPSTPTNINLSALGINQITAIFVDSESNAPITVTILNGTTVVQLLTNVISAFTYHNVVDGGPQAALTAQLSCEVVARIRFTVLGRGA